MRTRPTIRRGLTLLELLVVCAILAASVGASLYLATQGIVASVRAQRIAKATILAENELAYWRAMGGRAALALGGGEHRFTNPVAAAPENAGSRTRIEAREIEPGIVEIAATAALNPASPNHPIEVRLVTWVPTEGSAP
jgi:prepilin-type N-terminal cleavage/methylation domain-containing protein